MEWDEPSLITNAIIDIKNDFEYGIKFIQEIKEIACHSLQIRIYEPVDLKEIENLLSKIGKGRISTVELILNYHNSCQLNKLTELCENFHRISIIVIGNSKKQDLHSVRPQKFW